MQLTLLRLHTWVLPLKPLKLTWLGLWTLCSKFRALFYSEFLSLSLSVLEYNSWLCSLLCFSVLTQQPTNHIHTITTDQKVHINDCWATYMQSLWSARFVQTVSQRNLLVVSRETASAIPAVQVTHGKPVTTLSVTVRQIFGLYCVRPYGVPRFSFARELEWFANSCMRVSHQG